MTMEWIKPSSSGGGNCAEAASDGGEVLIRNSKRPREATVRFTPDEWRAFLDGAKAGEFDHLTGGEAAVLRRELTNAQARLLLARDAILADSYFMPHEVGPDIAPRITERLRAFADQLDAARERIAGLEDTLAAIRGGANEADMPLLKVRGEAPAAHAHEPSAAGHGTSRSGAVV
jgi:hypothetical protein